MPCRKITTSGTPENCRLDHFIFTNTRKVFTDGKNIAFKMKIIKCILLLTCAVAIISPGCCALANTTTQTSITIDNRSNNSKIRANNENNNLQVSSPMPFVDRTSNKNGLLTNPMNINGFGNNSLLANHSNIVAANETHAHKPKLERYPVAVVNFARVEMPFIIGLWILYACIGKLGKLSLIL